MGTIEQRYKSFLKTDIQELAKGKARKFVWLLSTLGIEFLHGKFYERNFEEYPQKPHDGKVTVFNSPLYDNLILDSGGIDLRIDMVLIDVSMTKNIVKTAIQGMSGTVKECI